MKKKYKFYIVVSHSGFILTRPSYEDFIPVFYKKKSAQLFAKENEGNLGKVKEIAFKNKQT